MNDTYQLGTEQNTMKGQITIEFTQIETIEARYTIYVPEKDIGAVSKMTTDQLEDYILNNDEWIAGKEAVIDNDGPESIELRNQA